MTTGYDTTHKHASLFAGRAYFFFILFYFCLTYFIPFIHLPRRIVFAFFSPWRDNSGRARTAMERDGME